MKYGMRADERCIVTVLPLSLIVTLNSTSPRWRGRRGSIEKKSCGIASRAKSVGLVATARTDERHRACFTAQLNTI